MLFQKPTYDWIVAGLGNPGREYAGTRHNVGFCVLDALADALGVRLTRLRLRAMTANATLEGQKLLLMQPQTYMNASGMAVGDAARYYHIPPERIIVVFDDISLPPGRIRVRAEGSAGGHNGIKSIIHELGSQSFPRVKVGVGAKPHPEYDLADWVLSTFSASEQQALAPAIEHAAAAVQEIILHGTASAANRFNGVG